jgi:inorganic phosphate transporter, PiT family
MDSALFLLLIVVVLGLIFEFVNGFHDAANAIATIVATRVLNPLQAVSMAAVLNFLGAISGTAVATTVGKGLVDPKVVTQETVVAALLGAIIWDLITWYYGLPTSSSHALLFSVLGAGVATAGWEVVVTEGVTKVLVGLVYSPLFGILGGLLLVTLIYRLLFSVHPGTVSGVFGRAQLLSSAYMAFSHGSNDGQKTMGIIALALFTYGALGSEFYIPVWVIIAAGAAIALGTASGGWRIIRTMGTKLTLLKPVQGFAAETAAATVIEIATRFGTPISTTHAISSAIMGVGAARGARAVRWGVAGQIITAWIVTLPGCFLFGYVIMSVLRGAQGLFGR